MKSIYSHSQSTEIVIDIVTCSVLIVSKKLAKKSHRRIKSPSVNAKGLGMFRLPQQNDFRTFCMSDETEKVYHKLEEVIRIC